MREIVQQALANATPAELIQDTIGALCVFALPALGLALKLFFEV